MKIHRLWLHGITAFIHMLVSILIIRRLCPCCVEINHATESAATSNQQINHATESAAHLQW